MNHPDFLFLSYGIEISSILWYYLGFGERPSLRKYHLILILPRRASKHSSDIKDLSFKKLPSEMFKCFRITQRPGLKSKVALNENQQWNYIFGLLVFFFQQIWQILKHCVGKFHHEIINSEEW